MIRTSQLAVAAIVGLGAAVANSQAASIGLVAAAPDIRVSAITTTYNAANKTFDATGFLSTLTLPNGSPTAIAGSGTFNLHAVLNVSPAGVVTPGVGSTLAVTGFTGPTNYFSSSTLLDVGFTQTPLTGNPSNIQTFEFLFGPGGGLYGSSNQIGIILTTPILVAGGGVYDGPNYFDTSFSASNTAGGAADVYAKAVPLPSAAWMGISALGAVGLFKLRRKSRTA